MEAESGGPMALATETLTGDIRDAVLGEFKTLSKPWQQMSEEEQERAIHRARDIAETLVREAVDLIAARGLPALPIEIGKVTIDGAAMKGTYECYADDDNLLRIRHLQGSRAMFVLASPAAFQGERASAEPDADEPGLPLDQERPDEANVQALEKKMKRNAKANGAKPPAAELPRADTSSPPFAAPDEPAVVANP